MTGSSSGTGHTINPYFSNWENDARIAHLRRHHELLQLLHEQYLRWAAAADDPNLRSIYRAVARRFVEAQSEIDFLLKVLEDKNG